MNGDWVIEESGQQGVVTGPCSKQKTKKQNSVKFWEFVIETGDEIFKFSSSGFVNVIKIYQN